MKSPLNLATLASLAGSVEWWGRDQSWKNEVQGEEIKQMWSLWRNLDMKKKNQAEGKNGVERFSIKGGLFYF